MRIFEVEVSCSVRIEIPDDRDIFLRCIENHNDQGVPQPDVRGGRGWRNVLYDLKTEGDVIEMFTYNAVANGVFHIYRLEGWGDLDWDAGSMDVRDVEVGGWVELSENT